MLYIIREGPFLLVAVLGNDGKLGERKPWFAMQTLHSLVTVGAQMKGESDREAAAALGRRFRGRQQLS